MLSMSVIGSSANAKAYYAEYAQEKGEAEGKFYDRTGELGIDGKTVAGADMQALLEGYSPDRSQALCRNAGESHRGGWDLSYSAPKSVSIVWANASPEMRGKIEAAQEKAVRAGLDYMSDHAAYTRTGHGGAHFEKASLVAATFQHSSNRKEQPQLHTHAVVFNVARSEHDMKWRTLEGRELFNAKMASGAIYRAELASGMQRLGYEVECTEKANFRVKGVPLGVQVAQSDRSREIDRLLAEQGLTRETAPAQLKEYLALKSRDGKNYERLTRDFGRWQKENSGHGFGPKEQEQLEAAQKDRRPVVRQAERNEMAEKSLDGLTQQASTFGHHDLARKVAEASIGRQGSLGIEGTLREAKASQNFLTVGRTSQGIEQYSTNEMVAVEKDLMERIAARRGEARHQVEEKSITAAIEKRQTPELVAESRAIKPEQAQALRHVTEGRDGVTFIEGDAGTGKSYLMSAVKEVYEKDGYNVHGLSFTNKAAQGLEQGSGIKSRSVDSFLYAAKNGKNPLDGRSVVILDEAGMLDSRKTRELVKTVSDAGAKLVMVGDEKQIQPILAGQAFGTAKRAFGSERLSEIVRQRQAWEAKAVNDLAEGRTKDALTAIAEKGNLKFAPDRNAARREMIAEWHKGTDAGVEKAPLMLATTNAEVRSLNEAARTRLKADGRLGPGETFQTAHGKAEFAAGDRIIFTGNDKRQGILNSTLGTVEKVGAKERTLTVMTETNQRITFNADEMTKFRHGYAVTTHKSQGSTVDKALVLVDGYNMDREKIYVAFSRGREGNMIFADKPTVGELTKEEAQSLKGLSGEERQVKEDEHFRGHLAKMVGASHRKDTTQDYGDRADDLDAALKESQEPKRESGFTSAGKKLEERWQESEEKVERAQAREAERAKEEQTPKREHGRGEKTPGHERGVERDRGYEMER